MRIKETNTLYFCLPCLCNVKPEGRGAAESSRNNRRSNCHIYGSHTSSLPTSDFLEALTL